MKTVLIFFVCITVFNSCFKAEDEFTKKLCDPSLSDEKIAELEKCEKILPKEVRNDKIYFKDFKNQNIYISIVYFNVQLIKLFNVR
jgi:hypothetical protein